MTRPTVCIVSPAAALDNNGNAHTAARWQRFLEPLAEVRVQKEWDGLPADLMIALHARRSASSIARFRARDASGEIVLVLTGTDLYRDIHVDESASHSLQCASRLVVLQHAGVASLPAEYRARTTVIVQSAPMLLCRDDDIDVKRPTVDIVAVGHLRSEKDPETLMKAAELLPSSSRIRITHVGKALDPALEAMALRTADRCSAYHWVGALSHEATRALIARSRVLVHTSVMEGGANVIIEAVRSRVPVIASRIDGNLGLLGADYAGYFEVGDPAALAAVLQRFERMPAFEAELAATCRRLEPEFAPELEEAAVRRLLVRADA